MAIHELFDREECEEISEESPLSTEGNKGHLFSTLVTRFCFLLLLLADCIWLIYNAVMTLVFALVYLATGGRIVWFGKRMRQSALNCRRSVVCALALIVGLFSPPFGIMVACTYFLMYDKAGMDEVVPAPLQSQFKDIFKA